MTMPHSLGDRLGPHLRGHLLLFESSTMPRVGAEVATRLLGAAMLLETIRLAATSWLSPALPLWLIAPGLLVAAWFTLRRFVRAMPVAVGLHPWRNWSATERSYLPQVLLLGAVVFGVILGPAIAARAAAGGWLTLGRTVFVPYLLYGFYQEAVYRGAIQTALVERAGAGVGVLLANILFTFGPLHAHFYSLDPSRAVPLFAGTFAIGMIFGLIYHRSGNLWIPALMHALGNAMILAAATG